MVNKKGQLAIFIILALAIIVVVVLIFINRGSFDITITPQTPVEEIINCIQEVGEQGVDILNSQGGSLNPENYYLYQGNKIEYLCYTHENYERCVMQKPLLKQNYETELETYMEEGVNNCLTSSKESLVSKGYTVTFKQPEISVDLVPNNILIEVDSDLEIRKDKTESYKVIKTDINSNIYSLVIIASSISNWEARYGDSESMNYMMYYPSLRVEKKVQSDGTTVYILTEKVSEDKFMFASRSVALPAELGRI
ncbi:hypothetical protein HOD75_04905 [archaeon]|jgi:hypothetical protein|nr:hypothetical protein [archaeon]MBT4242204.1 hypothetical protein [archaeon]MBT4417892.1 hypothetical protein [archaeon]